MSQIPISAAALSNYEGMTALVDKEECIYLGKTENYHFTPSTPDTPMEAYYDNSDGSLVFVSDNVKMFHFLYGEGWVLPQKEMLREHYFRRQDYREFARLREGVLAQYPLKREVTFSSRPFLPPKSHNRARRKAGTIR